jgi:hypothetical protein
MFGARARRSTAPGRARVALLGALAGCLVVTGCGASGAPGEVAPSKRLAESFNSDDLMNQLSAALTAKDKNRFLAVCAESIRPTVALWWDNLAALGTTVGVVADAAPGVATDENGNATVKIAAGARVSVDPINADLKREKAAPTTEYQLKVHVDEATRKPTITSWVSIDHAPWDAGKRLYVRKMGSAIVAGYPEERAAIDRVASAAKKAADYDIALYRSAGPNLLYQKGFVVFTSASAATRDQWFGSAARRKGLIGDSDGTTLGMPTASTNSGEPFLENSTAAARVVVRPDRSATELTTILVHEFVHANLMPRSSIWGSGDGSMPAWIAEGIARMVEDTYRSSPDPTRTSYSAQFLKDSLSTVSKDKLTGVLPTDQQLYGPGIAQWYDVAASVYYYIGHTYNLGKMFSAADSGYSGSDPFANVIKSADSKGYLTMYDASVIKQGWKNWLAETYG